MKRIFFVVVVIIMTAICSAQISFAASSIKFPFLFTDNRQYDGRFNFDDNGFWGPRQDGKSQIRNLVIAGADINREGIEIPEMTFSAVPGSEETISLTYHGNSGGLIEGYIAGFANQDLAIWEDRIYTYTLYNALDNQIVDDTITIDTSNIDYRPIEMPIVTITSGDDPLHPTISWTSVPNVDSYRVLVLNISCVDGMPVIYNPLYISGRISGLSHTIPADVNAIVGKDVAIWVQAREEVTEDGLNYLRINRSSYYARYSPFGDLPSENLIIEGWTLEKYPDENALITVTAQADSIELTATTANEGDDYFGKYQKTVSGLRGVVATLNVSEAEGESFVGIRKNVALLANGNIVKAEIRLQHTVDGYRFVRYRVKELQKDTWNEIYRIANGNIGSEWYFDQDYTFGIALIDDMIVFFSHGINKFCGPVVIPLTSPDFDSISSRAEISVWAYRNTGDANNAYIRATARDVKFIMENHLPKMDEDIPGDFNRDGKIGIDDAINILQVTSGSTP